MTRRPAGQTRERRIVRGARAIAVALAALALLAGCVAIPSSSGVNEGPEVKNGGGGPGPVDLPQGPSRGASKTEIFADFLQAATSSVGSYQIAREFLTTKASQGWDPTKSVLIREKPSNPQDLGDNQFSYTVSTNASVNALGVYSQQATNSDETLNYSFSKVNGQWRISGLPDGIVLSRESFSNTFAEYPIYFYDPAFRYLVPDVRWFPSGTTVPNRIVAALIAGPSDWLQNGVVTTAFPAGVSVGSPVVVRGSSAVVDFSADAASAKPTQRAQMQNQLQWSLQGDQISSASMTAHGAPITVDASLPTQGPVSSANSAPLVLKGKQFGFYPRLDSFGALSTQLVDLGPSAIELNGAQTIAAALTGAGVYRVTGSGQPRLVDSRPNLIAPTIDPSGYIWTVPAIDASAIVATGSDGVQHAITSTVPSGSAIVSMHVSHDGTRLLMYLTTSAGPELVVAGIVRRSGVPASLGELLDLPVSSGQPLDATWVDPSTVAALTSAGGESAVSTYVIGGTVGDSTTTVGAVHLAGAFNIDSLRLITGSGEVQQLRASGWQDIFIASVLATQQ